ncbi:MAG TPA: VWA domain-containing protein [Pseudogracilibacillus sp.]|nr:VWA domain-containing protein [Pseudogracilibacillus sp.]
MAIKRWDGAAIDTTLYLLLQDLTDLYSGYQGFHFTYQHGALLQLYPKQISASHFWATVDPQLRIAGYKTDVFLRGIGTMQDSDIPALQSYLEHAEQSELPHFAKQMLTLLEDIRLEERIRMNRPGTRADFEKRTKALRNYFQTQLQTNVTQGNALDELFCLVYLQLHAEEPDPRFSIAKTAQKNQLETLKPILFDIYAATTTEEVTRLAERILSVLNERYTDMEKTYMTFPIKEIGEIKEQTVAEDLKRTDPLTDPNAEESDRADQEAFEESLPTWHQEDEHAEQQQNYLQAELESGTKTNITEGGAPRETEEGDEAMGTMQGSSLESSQNDYSATEALDKQASHKKASTERTAFGKANQYAVEIWQEARSATAEEEKLYEQYVDEVDSFRRRLASTIEKVLDYKRNAPTQHLLAGHLSKKLLPLILEDNPRVFYKKSSESKEIDAAVSILVDCSASMHNKMEETKRGIVLFHEVLTQLQVPHSIVGFWEDAIGGSADYQPNYFHVVHRFEESPYANTGSAIMQLEPEEDNRDGFSIRVVTRELLRRQAKNKFLLVFTDGEPAAFNYQEDGIVDTNVAVSEAEKQGIEVIGTFLADGEIDPQADAMMQNIYGRNRLLIPDVSEIPDQFASLLKQLLLKIM